MRGLLRLYPRWWRRRYGDEMAALLEEMPRSPGVVLDMMKGAVMARFEDEPVQSRLATAAGPMAVGLPRRRLPRPGRSTVALLLIPALVTVAMVLLLPPQGDSRELLPEPLYLTYSLISNRHMVLGMTVLGTAIASWHALFAPRRTRWIVGTAIALGLLAGILRIYLPS